MTLTNTAFPILPEVREEIVIPVAYSGVILLELKFHASEGQGLENQKLVTLVTEAPKLIRPSVGKTNELLKSLKPLMVVVSSGIDLDVKA